MNIQNKVRWAEVLAAQAHSDAGQLYDGKPYIEHCKDVVEVLLDFDITDKNLLAAGYLHDVIEDCGMDPFIIEYFCGKKVVELVQAVSDGPGETREIRKMAVYEKLVKNSDGLALKLADRIANVTYALEHGDRRMQKLYKKEQTSFEKNTRIIGVHDAMWNHLNALLGRVQ